MEDKRGDPSIYVGETSRSLAERTTEHWKDASSNEEESHMKKHWNQTHSEEEGSQILQISNRETDWRGNKNSLEKKLPQQQGGV